MTALNPPGFYYPVVCPADIEFLALYFLTPLMSPTPVATRLPDDSSPNDTINGFIRVEAGGGVKLDYARYNQTILVHTYVPAEFEIQGAEIANKAIAFMSAAAGCQVNGWQISDVPHCSVVQRRSDPLVNLLRYISFVTWTVAGAPIQVEFAPEPVLTDAGLSGSGILSATT